MTQSSPADPLPPEQPSARALAVRNANALRVAAARDDLVAPETEDDGIDLRQVLRIVLKYKWMLLAFALVSGLIAAVQSLRATPMYRTAATVQIERAAQRVVAFGSDVDTEQQVWDDGSQLLTQIELLKSRAIAERVIDEMGLNRRRGSGELPDSPAGLAAGGVEVDQPAQKPSGFLDRILSNYRQISTPAVKNEQFLDRDSAVAAFRGSVLIEPVKETRLVNIVVTNSDPQLAARIANSMAKTFMAVNLERRLESSTYAQRFLEDQIKGTKTKLEDSERLINDYSKRNQILALADKSEVASQNFAALSSSLARAEEERIRAESLYNEVARNPESAPQVLDSKAVQALKEQRAKLEAEYTQNLSTFKPEFPRMVQLKTQIDDLNGRIRSEVNIVVGSVKAQFEAARQQELQLRERVGQSRAAVETVQDRSVDLNLLMRELDTNRQVYDSLLQRLKEVSVTSGLTSNNISIVDEAQPPLFPFSPQPERYALIGMSLGLLLGLALAFLREMLDDSVKHPDEIEPSYGLPVLGLIPLVKNAGRVGRVAALVHDDPRSPFAEAYRSMRTALQFSTNDGAPKLMMVTSCGKAEGKTTTAIALAINFAQLGKKVLLIDADMRNPSVHKTMKLPNEHGLSNFLAGEPSAGTLIQNANIANLSILTAGPTPPDPVDLLLGQKLQLLLEKANELGYAQVIVDSPPLLGIADAVVLGNQIPHVVFTIKAGSTRKSAIKDALRRLRHGGITPMGVVLTHVSDKHGNDYGYGSYYGYDADQATRQGLGAAMTGGRAQEEMRSASSMGGSVSALFRAASWPRGALATVVVGGVLALGVGGWWLWPGEPEVAAAPFKADQSTVKGVVQVETTPATPASVPAAPLAQGAEVAGAAATTMAAAVAQRSQGEGNAVAPLAAAELSKKPDFLTIQDKPGDIWPPLGELWGVKLNPANPCENAISLGVQCFRQLGIGLPELRALGRPGLVQLKQESIKRWVLLRGMDSEKVTLFSGGITWQLPLAEFQMTWSGAFTTLWRLPPDHRERVFAATESDPAGQWLNEQLKQMQAKQILAPTEDSLEARVTQFQKQNQLPRDGKAMPTVFVLVNLLTGVDEPRV
jgi:capsular exopolysaccharide synthesis family protein